MSAKLFGCEANLIGHLADWLASQERRNLSHIGVLLPTRRLQNYLRLELATRLTACVPPHILTLEDLVARLPLDPPTRRITVEEQRFILKALLLQKEYRHLRPGMETDLARFFNELTDEKLGAAAFDQVRTLLHQDPYRNEQHIEMLLQQVDEWEDLFRSYLDFLHRHHLADPSLDFYHRVMQLPDEHSVGRFWNIKRFYILGFSDATAIQCHLFRHMLAHDECEFWFHADPFFLEYDGSPPVSERHPFSVLEKFLSRLKITDVKVQTAEKPHPHLFVLREAFTRRPQSPDSPQAVRLYVHKTMTLLSEVKAVAALIRKLIAEQNVAPQEIIVAVPDERIYGRMIWSVFEQAGIPLNFALGIPFQQTMVGQWLRMFFELVQHQCRHQDMLSLFTNPLCEHWLQKLNLSRTAGEFQFELQRFMQKFDLVNDLEFFIKIAEQERETELLSFFNYLKALLEPFNHGEALPAHQWGEALLELTERLQVLPILSRGMNDPYNINARAIHLWYESLQTLIRSGEILPTPFSFADLYALLLQNVFSRPVPPAGEPFVGVQVIGLLEARSLPGKVLILPGLVEGCLPAGVERELFIGEPFREQIGLTSFLKREQLQDQRFYHLVASFPQVHLFWHEYEADTPAVKSRYLQRLELVHQTPHFRLEDLEEQGMVFPGDYLSLAAAHPLPDRLVAIWQEMLEQIGQRRDDRGEFKGDRASLLSHFTVASLQDLIDCPFRFLLQRFDIGEEELPEEESDNRQLGRWLHDICYYFFVGLPESEPLDDQDEMLRRPWKEPIDETNAEAALQRLRRLSQVLKYRLRGRLDEFYQIYYATWPRFIKEESKRPRWLYQPSYFERKLHRVLPLAMGQQSREPEVSGRIDRLIYDGQEVAILDYKLRAGSERTRRAVENGLDVQMPLYYRLLKEEKEFAGVTGWSGEYYALLEEKVIRSSGQSDGESVIARGWKHLESRWQRRLQELLENGSAFEPLEKKSRCSYCAYSGICRMNESGYPVKSFREDWSL